MEIVLPNFRSLKHETECKTKIVTRTPLRCPETLFIFHENANVLFSAFRVVQGGDKTPKIMGCYRANFAFFYMP